MSNPNAGEVRRQEAYQRRLDAAEMARSRDHQVSTANGEEDRYPREDGTLSYIASFTKGLLHDRVNGIIAKPEEYTKFVAAINSGVPSDLAAIRIGIPKDEDWQSVVANGGSGAGRSGRAGVRGWESASAGLAYDLEGPDAQSVAMPPAPTLDSDELKYEMAELYLMALARDIPFNEWNGNDHIRKAVDNLNKTAWVSKETCAPDAAAELRRKKELFTTESIFRGIGPGTDVGPYISQFMLRGSETLGGGGQDGVIMYGAQEMSLKVRRIKEEKDWMTTYKAWMDVQNGADVGDAQGPDFISHDPNRRTKFISTPRDLATYVHFDALYQAYLNACLIMLADKVPFDKGLPFGADDAIDSQQPFATFGGPHVLTLVTEVATRALKAVRYQKFNIHRRVRPEGVGGLLHLQATTKGCDEFGPEVEGIRQALAPEILPLVLEHNKRQNLNNADRVADGDSDGTYLLPMAFPEGSPMHPTYGAGHGTVAGACVTILKAFFDVQREYPGDKMVQADSVGNSLIDAHLPSGTKLTIEGELNKVASNIAFGRSFAGVHYASDNIESLLLGEQIAIGILQEQKLMFGEEFLMCIPLFSGKTMII